MRTRQLIRVTAIGAVAALAVALGFVVRGGVAQAATPVRIMPLGDSITGSPGCWRALLWNRLQNAGYTNIDFVGTLPPQGCGVPYDGDNEGHGGALVTNVADSNQLVGWLAATQPDVVMMHFGTNDVWSNRPTQQILDAYSTLVDQMRASNASMRILVAQIIPMNPDNCSECASRVVALNNAIPGWAASKSTPQSPITVVDQWTGFSTATDTYDGVHPNASGDQKMADTWYPALVAAIESLGGGTTTTTTSRPPTTTTSRPPTTTTSRPPTTTTTTSNPPTGGCQATYTKVNEWPGGFQGEVQVTNTGSGSTTSWTVTVTFPNGQRITQIWNGQTNLSGASPYTVANVSYNGSIPPGQSTTFGFLGSWSDSNNSPSVTCSRTP